MTKVEHIRKFLNDELRNFLETDEDPYVDEFCYNKELETTFGGEVFDITFKYARHYDHQCYWYEVDNAVIGITGYYDSWGGGEWEDEFCIGELRTVTSTFFIRK